MHDDAKNQHWHGNRFVAVEHVAFSRTWLDAKQSLNAAPTDRGCAMKVPSFTKLKPASYDAIIKAKPDAADGAAWRIAMPELAAALDKLREKLGREPTGEEFHHEAVKIENRARRGKGKLYDPDDKPDYSDGYSYADDATEADEDDALAGKHSYKVTIARSADEEDDSDGPLLPDSDTDGWIEEE
jgi:hypothetical protein